MKDNVKMYLQSVVEANAQTNGLKIVEKRSNRDRIWSTLTINNKTI